MALVPRANNPYSGHGKAVSTQEAVDALARFRDTKQLKQLDPTNEEHIKAYKVLRLSSGRVDWRKLLNYINNNKQSFEHGAAELLDYWGVPKNNFPEGLPADIETKQMQGDELEEAELVGGGKVDTVNYYVAVSHLTALGKGGNNARGENYKLDFSRSQEFTYTHLRDVIFL